MARTTRSQHGWLRRACAGLLVPALLAWAYPAVAQDVPTAEPAAVSEPLPDPESAAAEPAPPTPGEPAAAAEGEPAAAPAEPAAATGEPIAPAVPRADEPQPAIGSDLQQAVDALPPDAVAREPQAGNDSEPLPWWVCAAGAALLVALLAASQGGGGGGGGDSGAPPPGPVPQNGEGSAGVGW